MSGSRGVTNGAGPRHRTCPAESGELGNHILGIRVSRDEQRVAASRSRQLVVRARLRDPAAVEHHDLIGVANGREPVGDGDRRAPLDEPFERLLDQALGLRVERDVASSSTRIGGLRSTVRAIAMRCFSPPENR